MNICEFCLQFEREGTCRLGLKMPNGMSCREFSPTLEKFCADRKDFVNQKQIVEMATFFQIKGAEMKKVKLMARQEETSRLESPRAINPASEPLVDTPHFPYASFNLRK